MLLRGLNNGVPVLLRLAFAEKFILKAIPYMQRNSHKNNNGSHRSRPICLDVSRKLVDLYKQTK
jgi:hypothetical protein